MVSSSGYSSSNSSRGLTNALIALVQERLLRTFGLHLKEVKKIKNRQERINNSNSLNNNNDINGTSSANTYYIVVSELPEEKRRK